MNRAKYDKELIKWVKSHYWDSLEKDKDLILRHLRTCMCMASRICWTGNESIYSCGDNAPLWYTANEIEEFLKRDGYPNRKDMSVFLAKHLQCAFEKGWSKGNERATSLVVWKQDKEAG